MTTISTQCAISLDEGWVDHILVTAFDGHYGSCWNWSQENEDVANVRCIDSATVDTVLPDVHLLKAVELDLGMEHAPSGRSNWRPEALGIGGGHYLWAARADEETLSWACGQILSDESLNRTETARQLREAITSPNELPDLDAEACDVIVQVAVFGEVIYG